MASDIARQEFTRLLTPGVLGLYTHFEVTEVFVALQSQTNVPWNVFSLAVAESRPGEELQAARLLNPERIALKSLPGWNFGVMRYTRPIGDLGPAFDRLAQDGTWAQSGRGALTLERGILLPRRFVPPDGTEVVPLNEALKNNFWNGSHVFEWFDDKKTKLEPLLNVPVRIQELSEAIQKLVPIRLASLSDRLGNLIIQLPVTVLMSSLARLEVDNGFVMNVAWHPEVPPRPLRGTCVVTSDVTLKGYAERVIQAGETNFQILAKEGPFQSVLWDDANDIELAATAPTYSVTRIALNTSISYPTKRVFDIEDRNGHKTSWRVPLVTTMPENLLGGSPQPDEQWARKRLYRGEVKHLEETRRFVQYKPQNEEPSVRRDRALKDLRYLINEHGRNGVWLWDPYLSGHDIVETLFHCKYANAELRALTNGQAPPSKTPRRSRWCGWFTRVAETDETETKVKAFIGKQRELLDATANDSPGLRLEYRIRLGSAGWPFHDRFLIFPGLQAPALAWSLGASVNHLGEQHHILQQALDGQLIADAFESLWSELAGAEYLIWKKP